jgi:hypothetical protein
MDKHSQRRLDVAVLKQALLDLRLRTDDFRMKAEQQEECIDQMLEAARWLFANRHPNHVLSLQGICERLGVDTCKLARRVFEGLSLARQQEIRGGLRHYRGALFEAT